MTEQYGVRRTGGKMTERGRGMRTIIVTGADRGLGYAICENLLDKGEKVLAGQYMPEWRQLEKLRERFPGRLFLIPLDVGDDASVRAAAELFARYAGAVDILINCAGINGQIRDIRDGYDFEEMMHTINVNALGAVRMVQACLPLMDKGTEKKVCCISSEAGSIEACRRSDETEYCMSKAALNMGMKVLYNRLSPEGYDFRLYHPGWMNTYMMGEKEEHADLEPETAAELALETMLAPRRRGRLELESYDGKVLPW